MADKDAIVNALSGEDQAAMQPETFANPMVKALLAGAATNAAVPGQMMTPNPYPPGSEEADWYEGQRYNKGIQWAPHEAVSLISGGMPAAQAGTAGIFGGKLARTADFQNLKLAEGMANTGKYTPEHIYDATGWFKHPADNKWRFEIPDNNMKLNYMPPGEGDMASGPMHAFVDHKELYKAYPSLRDINTQVTKQSSPLEGKGLYNSYPFKKASAIGPDSDVTKSILGHELQHGVQDIEKFSYGADPTAYRDMIATGLQKNPNLLPPLSSVKDTKKQLMEVFGQAYPLYRKTAGEVEARNVQHRLDFTPKDRKNSYPWVSQDTPYHQQIDYNPWGPQQILRALQPK